MHDGFRRRGDPDAHTLTRPGCLLIPAVLLLAEPPAVLPGCRPADRASAPAKALQTEHFLLMHGTTQAQARALGARLEAVYRANVRLARELHANMNTPAHKLAVIFYDQYAEFQASLSSAGLDDSSLGYFDPAENRCTFFDFETHPDVVRLRQELAGLHQDDWARRKRLSAQIAASLTAMNERIVQHEAAHMIQANVGLIPPGSAPPAWLVEGLAELFELPFVERGASIALSVNRYRLREFQRLHPGHERLAELRRLVAGEAWRGGPDYSLAWALTNYLYIRQRQRFATYVRAATTPAEAPAASKRVEQFEDVFGPLDSEFAAQFGAYMSGLIARNLTPSRPVKASP
jgi:hypothetical protein